MSVQRRLRDLRARLPRQATHARVASASLLFGPLYGTDALHRHIGRTLPWRFGAIRRVKMAAIERADVVIPDDVLLRYDDALGLGVFARFLVARPAYYWRPAGTPCLVAVVAGTEQWAVIARWPE